MAEVSKIDIDGVQWGIKDATAREQVAALNEVVEEHSSSIEGMASRIDSSFFAKQGAIRVKTIDYRPFIISGYIEGIGIFFAVARSEGAQNLVITSLLGSVSEHLTVTVNSDFDFTLSLNGEINIMGFFSSVE